jgi:predicted DNA-binding WGR domain protein
MLKRELIHPETHVKVTLWMARNYVQIDDPTKQHGSHFGPMSQIYSPQSEPESAFHDQVRLYLDQGYQETEASKSRRVLQVRNGDQPSKYWIIELSGELCETHYGKFPNYGYWIGSGTKKDIDCDTSEQARDTYTQLIVKKLKEGYSEYYRRENEYTALTDAALAAPPRPAKVKAPAKPVTSVLATSATDGAGTQRYEFSEGDSNKFWEIALQGRSYNVTFGRIGTAGQVQTKEFASEAEAKKSFDKLVAEKVKKGYQLVSAPASAEPAATPAPRAASTPVKKEKQPAAEPAAVIAKSNVILDVLREIDLHPWEIAAVRYRKQGVVERGEPREFNLKQCCQQLGEIQTEQYGWQWRWDQLDLPVAMTREEAHFWLAVILDTPTRQSPKQVAKDYRQRAFNGTFDFDTIAGRLGKRGHYGVDPVIMLPMGILFELDQLVGMILAPPDHSHVPAHQVPHDFRADVCEGLALYVAPFIEESDLDAVRDRLRKNWKPAAPPANHYLSFDATCYLAAALGMHDEVEEVLSLLPDDHYQQNKMGWGDHYQRPQSLCFGLGSSEAVARELRRLQLKLRRPRWIRRFLACTECSSLDIVYDSIVAETNKEEAGKLLDELAIVHAPEAAEWMLDLKLNSKAPAVARDWLNKYVGCAITGLVETAGGRGKLADAAVQYLREAKAIGHGELIAAAVATLPDNDVKSKVVRDVLEHREKSFAPFDEVTTPQWYRDAELDTVAPPRTTLPSWALPAVLPPIVVGEHRLNDSQVEAVLKLMTKARLSDPPALLKAIRANASRTSLDAFAWKLFESWLQDGANSKDKWAMLAIGFLGGDHCVLKLTPLLKIWPGESQHQRAVAGLECLRAVGSDTALMQLNGIANKLKFQGLKNKAREFMGQIAHEKGLTPAELEDRIVPDLDLDARGSREFDFGTRKFKFALSADLKPMIRDEDGKLKKDLPKPGKTDDAALAADAQAQWRLLKKQLAEAVKVQVPRLEQAMVTGRRWNAELFDAFIVRHPLMVNFARTLLWGTYDSEGRLTTTFRVTEEQDLATVDDEACSLPADARVGLVHPAHLDAQLAAKWGEVFSDYEIAPCFQQLGRKVYRLEPNEVGEKTIERFNGVKINPMILVGMLDRMGWARGIPEDGGAFHEHSKAFYGANVTAFLTYEEGIIIGYMDGSEDQKLTGCFFVKGIYTPRIYPKHENILPLGEVDAVVVSEVLRDLFAIQSKGT